MKFTAVVLMAMLGGAWFHHSPSCPFGSAVADGCATAPANGIFQNPTFFSTARQSGQAYTTRPTWNVAGVDYPVGYSSTTVFKDPTSGANAAALTAQGCTYDSVATLNCTNHANTTLDGWDFSVGGGIYVSMNTGLTGTITVSNCKFLFGSRLSTLANSTSAFITVDVSVGADFVLRSNILDGNGINFPNPAYSSLVTLNGAAGAFTATYNGYFRSAQNVTQTHSLSNRTEQFNYMEGMVYNTAHNHASWPSLQAANGTIALYTFTFNAGLIPSTSLGGGSEIIEIEGGGTSLVLTQVNIDHNTIVVNKNSVGGQTVAFNMSFSSFGSPATVFTNSSVTNNYFDATGAFGCYATVSAPTFTNPTVFSGNVDLTNGSSWTGSPACASHGF